MYANKKTSVACVQVMELLVHLNKRIKSRPKIQLPVETLLVQYQDPAAASFVTVRFCHVGLINPEFYD